MAQLWRGAILCVLIACVSAELRMVCSNKQRDSLLAETKDFEALDVRINVASRSLLTFVCFEPQGIATNLETKTEHELGDLPFSTSGSTSVSIGVEADLKTETTQRFDCSVFGQRVAIVLSPEPNQAGDVWLYVEPGSSSGSIFISCDSLQVQIGDPIHPQPLISHHNTQHDKFGKAHASAGVNECATNNGGCNATTSQCLSIPETGEYSCVDCSIPWTCPDVNECATNNGVYENNSRNSTKRNVCLIGDVYCFTFSLF
eukprot:c11778_g1_i4.p1 GENE.c11778_g1_i4~~c11778_g1_i4.p1  ORF type:complete len:259 (-),score=46.53 c11778_g1_i4:122-898(-)